MAKAKLFIEFTEDGPRWSAGFCFDETTSREDLTLFLDKLVEVVTQRIGHEYDWPEFRGLPDITTEYATFPIGK